MSYIRHNAIVVTSFDRDHIEEIRNKAIKIFGEELPHGSEMVGNVVGGVVNSQYSFFIAPDGSKKGWPTADQGDKARKSFLDYLDESNLYFDYAELLFGGDGDFSSVTRSSDSEIR